MHYHTIVATGLSIGLAFSNHALAANPNATVFLPAARPAFAEKLSPNLIGFSIEMDRWTSWAGEAVGKPNTYVNQVLSVMSSFTGASPSFRVGGELKRSPWPFTTGSDTLPHHSRQRRPRLHPGWSRRYEFYLPCSQRHYSLP